MTDRERKYIDAMVRDGRQIMQARQAERSQERQQHQQEKGPTPQPAVISFEQKR